MDHGYISDNNGIHEFPKNFILFILRKTGKSFKTSWNYKRNPESSSQNVNFDNTFKKML